MAADTEYYRALGVSESASDADIRKAFRAIAKENHPDLNPDDPKAETRFKEANEAYQVLSDPEKRGLYDKFGQVGLKEGFNPEQYERAQRGFGGFGGAQGPQGQGFGGQGFGGFHTGRDGGGIRFEDIFGGFGGGGRGAGPGGGGRRVRSVRDAELRLKITFDNALHGMKTNFTYHRSQTCKKCGGRGGSGGNVCPECQGRGSTSYQDKVAVNIPQGARTGDTIRLPKRGDIDAAGNAADLVLHLEVEDDPRFEPNGMDLVMETRVKPTDLLLGGTHTIEGPWGPITLTLKPGMDPGMKQRIPGRGMKRGAKKGDLFVEFAVEGQKLTKKQQKAIAKAMGAS